MAIVNSAAENVGVWVSVQAPTFSPFGDKLEVGLLGHPVALGLTLRSLHTVFRHGCTFPPTVYRTLVFSHHR